MAKGIALLPQKLKHAGDQLLTPYFSRLCSTKFLMEETLEPAHFQPLGAPARAASKPGEQAVILAKLQE